MIRLIFRPNDLEITPVPGQVMGRDSLGLEMIKTISSKHFEFTSVGTDSAGIKHLFAGTPGGFVSKGSDDVVSVPQGSEITLLRGDKYRVLSHWDAFYLEFSPEEETAASPLQDGLSQPVGEDEYTQLPQDAAEEEVGASLAVVEDVYTQPPLDVAEEVGASLPVVGGEPVSSPPGDIPQPTKMASKRGKFVQKDKYGYDKDRDYMSDSDMEDGAAHLWSSGGAAIVTEQFKRRKGFQSKLQKLVPAAKPSKEALEDEIDALDNERQCLEESGKWRSPTLIRRMKQKRAALLRSLETILVDKTNDDCDKLTVLWLQKSKENLLRRKEKLLKRRETATSDEDNSDLEHIEKDIADIDAKMEAAQPKGK
jgi:hypothetical protein